MNRSTLALSLLILVLLPACRIIQQPGVGGAIVSADNLHDCYEGECVASIDDARTQTFTATPEPGFEFVAWKQLCANESTPVCEIAVNAKLASKDIEARQVALFAPIPQDDLATERVVMDTNYGYVVIELFGGKAPLSVANFLGYVDSGFYDGTAIHRVDAYYIIQGGGFSYTEADGFQLKETNGPIDSESANGLSNLRGTIAMARRSDPDSAESQFFINLADNLSLDFVSIYQSGYTVFGRVVAGMDVIDTIGSLRNVSSSNIRPPRELVLIKSVSRHGPPGEP